MEDYEAKIQALVHGLMPIFNKLKNHPESKSFRQPVDPFGTPDYFDIIKNPMDLSTIEWNLETGHYKDPWQFIDDVRLMFCNVRAYNRKSSSSFKACEILSDIFEQNIDSVMLSLGYCCGQRYTFQPEIIYCYGNSLCTIPRDSNYWIYQQYKYCEKCFSNTIGDRVALVEDPTHPPFFIEKKQFFKGNNNHLDQEPFVECSDCGRKLHQICVLHFEKISTEGFTCDNCLKAKNEKRKENKFTAKRLQQTKLGQFLENHIKNFLRKMNCEAGDVTIRILSNSKKTSVIKPEMKARFVDNGDLPKSFPYRAKAIFAFQEIDGVEICFFGMQVQEYGSDCLPPNARCIYISYLDSINVFQPKQLRSPIYHELLIGYLDYAKQLGYEMAHIWACPPGKGETYIFHCHPTDQKIPNPKRLQNWYRKMLDKGMKDNVVADYKDIIKQATDNNITSCTELPYFHDGFFAELS